VPASRPRAEPARPRLVLGEREQPGADAAPLCRRHHGDVLEQQVIGAGGEHEQATQVRPERTAAE
jgi:hypothetical protein